jgi:hypothetical protein
LPDHDGLSRRAGRPWRAVIGVAVLGAALLPAAAVAAPVAPIHCGGALTKATPTIDDANLLDYSFHCDGDIVAYTLVVNRTRNDFSTVDDFSPTATVLNSTKTTVSSKQGIGCEGTIPGNGVNCFAQGSATPAVVTAWNFIQGQIDTTDPYCASIPAGSRAETVAEPQAVVQIVASDTAGNEFGPFPIGRSPACPPPPKPKPKPKPKVKAKPRHKAHKRATTKRTAR